MNHNSLVKKTIEFNDNLKHDNVLELIVNFADL